MGPYTHVGLPYAYGACFCPIRVWMCTGHPIRIRGKICGWSVTVKMFAVCIVIGKFGDHIFVMSKIPLQHIKFSLNTFNKQLMHLQYINILKVPLPPVPNFTLKIAPLVGHLNIYRRFTSGKNNLILTVH